MITGSVAKSALVWLIVGAWTGGLMGCGGKSLVLDGSPQSTPTQDAGPVPVARIPDRVRNFRADDTRLYWSTQSYKVQGCVFEDCEHTTVSYGTTEYGVLALGAHDLFWTSKTSTTAVLSCSKAGCDGPPRKVIQDTYLNPTELNADGDYFYWPSEFDTYRCPPSGCGDIPETVANESSSGALQFAGDSVYWAHLTYQGTQLQSPVLIRRARKDGSQPPTTVLSFTVTPTGEGFGGFAVDSTTMYWLDELSHVQSCLIDSCQTAPATTLVSTDTSKRYLQVDELGLYWTESNYSSIEVAVKFCALAGCPSGPQTLIEAPVGYSDPPFCLSSNYVYWQPPVQVGDGYTSGPEVRRIRKPMP